ncbi:MAG: TolC family protein [Acidobacteriota bacterium]|nr:TolC family protein [Acidobacteriota bacterium]
MFRFLVLFAAAVSLRSEIHTFTLKEAVDRALRQNPDIAMARLEEQKSLEGIRVAKDPFAPRIGVGSGLAYSSGFPLSIEGAAPSVVRAQASQYLFNRQQTYAVAQARETARSAGFATGSKRDEIAYRTASLYLDGDRAARLNTLAVKQVESLRKVVQTVHGRVAEGRDLPLEEKKANLDLQKALQRQETLTADQDFAERSLAIVLGYAADDRARAAADERTPPEVPATEEAAIEQALSSSKELKRLQSAMIAKGLEVKGAKAARLPRVDLVAQYALLARYNNYDLFFNHFQRHNGQLGISFQLPLLAGPGIAASVSQAEDDTSHLKIEMEAARNRITLDVHQSFSEIRRAETNRSVTRADLDYSRESLSILLAQMGEGRASLRQVEESRFQEDEKWIALYDAQFAAERARLNLLRQTGELAASLK